MGGLVMSAGSRLATGRQFASILRWLGAQVAGPLQVAVDVVMAGPGDLCVMVRSREAALALREHKFVPVDLALIGIVDELVVRPDGEFDYTLKEGYTKYT